MKKMTMILGFALAGALLLTSGAKDVAKFKKITTIHMLGAVYCVVISPDGKQVAAETEGGFKVFDLKSGKELYTFMPPAIYKAVYKRPQRSRSDENWYAERDGERTHIRFVYSPDGKQIMCPVWNEIKLFDSKTGQEIRTLKNEQTYFSDVKEVSGYSYNELWKEYSLPVWFGSAVYSPDGKYVAASSSDTGAPENSSYSAMRLERFPPSIIWSVESGEQVGGLSGDFLAYSHNGATVGQFYDFYASAYHLKIGKKVIVNIRDYFPVQHDARPFPYGIFWWKDQEDYDSQPAGWRFLPFGYISDDTYGSYMRSPYFDYGNLDENEKSIFESYDSIILEKDLKLFACSPDGARIATVKANETRAPEYGYRREITKEGEYNYSVQLSEVQTGRLLSAYLGNAPLASRPVAVLYSPDGSFIFAGLDDGSVRFWNAATGEEIKAGQFANAGSIASADFSKDGKYLAIGTSNGNITVYGK